MDGADMTDIVDRLRRYAGDLCLSSYLELEAAQEIEQLRKQNAELMEALGWYQKQAELCRKITKEGDTARHALDRDGGAYALAVISKARGES